MVKKIANFLINKMGRNSYQIDPLITNNYLIFELTHRFWEVLRGLLKRPFFKKSNGILFLGKKVTFRAKSQISFGKSVIIGNNVEINALSKNGITIGNNVSILKNTIIECTGVIRNLGEGLTIGNNVGIAQNCFIQVRGQVTIGNNVIFGPSVSIFSETHNHSDVEKFINEQGETRIGVNIEDGVWIGAGATILDGVTIGKNSIVAAKSLVNKNVPPFSIVAGIPAKIIKHRN